MQGLRVRRRRAEPACSGGPVPNHSDLPLESSSSSLHHRSPSLSITAAFSSPSRLSTSASFSVHGGEDAFASPAKSSPYGSGGIGGLGGSVHSAAADADYLGRMSLSVPFAIDPGCGAS